MRIMSGSRVGLLLVILTVPFAVFATLPDISQNPNKTAIDYLYDLGVINGYPDGLFHPERMINRAELIKILTIRNGVHPSADQFHHCFPDVAIEWFAPYVCYARQEGWINGYPDGTFRPGVTVNAAEAIKIIMTAIGFQPNRSSAASFVSGLDLNAWYAPYVQAAVIHRILENNNNSFIDIGRGMSRAAVAEMIYRSLVSGSGQTNILSHNTRRGGTDRTGSLAVNLPVITFADITKTYGDPSFTLSALSSSLGHITYESSNTDVVRINGSTATIVGIGTATIRVIQEANGRFVGGSATAAMTVNGITPSITFDNLTKSHIDANFTLSPTSNSPGAFTFTSGNTSLVSISGNTADIVGTNGTVAITAHQAASGNYAAANQTMIITVFATYCSSVPCMNGGTCVPTLGGNGSDYNFLCTCPNDHYGGIYCEESDLNCFENGGDLICNNGGACVKDIDGGVCECAGGFCGTYCQILPMSCGV